MGQKNDNEIVLNQKAVQMVLLFILCLMSLQPLVGVTSNFWSARSGEELSAMITNFFLMKSELIRYNGYVALLVAIFVSIFTERVTIIQYFKKLYSKKPWNVCFTLLLIWVIVNVFTVSPYQDISLNGDAYRFEGLFSIIAYAGFFACASLLKDDKLKEIWINVSIAASTLLGICAVHSLYAKEPMVLTYMNRQISGAGPLMATFPQFNHYGYYLCVMTVLVAGCFLKETVTKKKVIYAVLFAFHQYVLTLNGTRGAYLAAICAMIFLTVSMLTRKDTQKKSVILLWVLVIAATLAPANALFERVSYSVGEIVDIANNTEIVGPPTSGRNRLILWSNAIELIKMYPIQGFGLNMANYAMAQVRKVVDMPHNEYLQHFVDLGVLGFAPYVIALFTLFFSTMKKIKELPAIVLIAGCGVIGYAISAFFGVTIVEVLPFFYILLGFVKWEKPVEA